MSSSTTQLPQKSQKQNQDSLLLGILIWFVHQNLLYGLSSVSCKWAFLTAPLAGLTGLQWVDIVLTLIALALILYMIFTPWRNWRRMQAGRPRWNPEWLAETEQDRGAFMAFLAMGLNVFFLLFVLATFAPLLALKACGQA